MTSRKSLRSLRVPFLALAFELEGCRSPTTRSGKTGFPSFQACGWGRWLALRTQRVIVPLCVPEPTSSVAPMRSAR